MQTLSISNLTVGDLVAFQIGTHDGYSSTNQHKWGVIKLLHLSTVAKKPFVTVSVLDGLTDTEPTPLHVRFRSVLIEQRFKNRPKAFSIGKPMIFTSQTDAITLPFARIIGRETLLRPAERQAMPYLLRHGYGSLIGHIGNVALSLDHEDRARNDAVTWSAELDLSNQRWLQNVQAAKARWEIRLRGLTLATLLAETPLQNWDQRPELISPQITADVRTHVRSVLQDLAALGPKPPRPAARKILTAFVTWLNDIDSNAREVFETDEREDLMALLEEICNAIKQKPLIEELDALRNW